MSEKTLEKTYEPGSVEARWASFWIDQSLATPDLASGKPGFSMVIPPPNITGALHLGHALNSTLQDILARFKRMRGYNVLWLPGIDHAGIATQNVVEKQLAAEGLDRHQLGREAFIERVWKWKNESGGTIVNQLKRIGASCDWTRLRFTMDEGLSRAVREVFTRLYKEGLIYQGDYIINWCPRCHTALSDLEVEFSETDGSLWYMEYPLVEPVGGLKSLTVATTRPETMLGDTAVAVNPEDDRYKGLIGKKIRLPFVDREIPVIGDDSVSIEFGTGAVKITPAHDFNDFEVGRRHNLPSIKVMDESARMNENAGPFKGIDRYEARKRIVAGLEEKGLLQKIDRHKLMLGGCYRCSTVVEPTLSRQWFVKVGPLAEPAIKAVEEGNIRFVPKNWENLYFDWMRNIRDWCISRQIWWGHRIPAWHCKDCGAVTVDTVDPTACSGCGSRDIEQDPDVLDTWFSSALWPFSTLGWPDKTEELKAFYPTAVLSTSFDIIFFWVARMIMMGLKFAGGEPFKDVYIHALIRDAKGQKMSKSKGNVIDPLVMMEKYGTDALRFTLAVLAAQGRDIKLAEERISGYRNFCNKIWNVARFTLMNLEGHVEGLDEAGFNIADRWLWHRRNVCIREVSEAIEGYRFDEAARALYRFVWHELCDWYVELVKLDLRGENGPERKLIAQQVLAAVLMDTMKLLHPFMPFITEEIAEKLPGAPKSLMSSEFPKEGTAYPEDAARMEEVMDVIRAVRNIRTDMNVAPSATTDCTCYSLDAGVREILSAGADYIRLLARVKELVIAESGERPSDAVSALAGGGDQKKVEVFVPLGGLVDFEVEEKRLVKELEKTVAEKTGVAKKLSNKEFTDKAPAEVVEKDRARLDALEEKTDKLKAGLERIRSIRA
ncbi:MAG TPA: valine--tRNA ligase [Deltaproteobacteria bacterium]|nr:MAG: valine--tRNA ligase [Deltaproteobacteria bacterium GWA2_55_82]OGQ62816.1 MAG: valine--tRNA ligase [Deltaproteobacteria bacterium RIFCSPLOWO2_02_FULL_55_12]OIJ73537.1 MAG: valine--tRNA ligase [Deltaproteobacteria bacterium GWC2_55_46]HBG46270.1 valine--tRNA ligase [Deltaproteobacteria bacterium]HCY10177.1 valine--tRNA ligase [Deltaproteobacteria bacterium]